MARRPATAVAVEIYKAAKSLMTNAIWASALASPRSSMVTSVWRLRVKNGPTVSPCSELPVGIEQRMCAPMALPSAFAARSWR